MLKLGVIGTGAISHHFIEAAHTSGEYQLVAVYSRKLETAATFASRYQDIQLFEQLDDFFKSSFDVVYIASPNSLHFAQAKIALSAGKHVILESLLSLSHKNGWIWFKQLRKITVLYSKQLVITMRQLLLLSKNFFSRQTKFLGGGFQLYQVFFQDA